MSQSQRGACESQWYVLKRCLVMVALLLREGCLEKNELMAGVSAALGQSAYGDNPYKALEHDLGRLRKHLGITLTYRPGAGYILDDLGVLRIFDLPADAIQTLAFLQDNFGPEAPNGAEVRRLIQYLLAAMPPQRAVEIRRRALPNLGLRKLDQVDPQSQALLVEGVSQRRQVRFDYLAPRHKQPGLRTHTVEPLDLQVKHGHLYLIAYGLEYYSPVTGVSRVADIMRDFRVDSIISGTIQLLPGKVAEARRPKSYRLRYLLHPDIVRHRQVTPRFPETEVQIRPDGFAEITAVITDPFGAAQELLHYGAKC